MRRMHVFALGISLLAGCSAETSTPSTSQSGGSGTKSDYVALSQTIFMGDNVTQSWPGCHSIRRNYPPLQRPSWRFARCAARKIARP